MRQAWADITRAGSDWTVLIAPAPQMDICTVNTMFSTLAAYDLLMAQVGSLHGGWGGGSAGAARGQPARARSDATKWCSMQQRSFDPEICTSCPIAAHRSPACAMPPGAAAPGEPRVHTNLGYGFLHSCASGHPRAVKQYQKSFRPRVRSRTSSWPLPAGRLFSKTLPTYCATQVRPHPSEGGSMLQCPTCLPTALLSQSLSKVSMHLCGMLPRSLSSACFEA